MHLSACACMPMGFMSKSSVSMRLMPKVQPPLHRQSPSKSPDQVNEPPFIRRCNKASNAHRKLPPPPRAHLVTICPDDAMGVGQDHPQRGGQPCTGSPLAARASVASAALARHPLGTPQPLEAKRQPTGVLLWTPAIPEFWSTVNPK